MEALRGGTVFKSSEMSVKSFSFKLIIALANGLLLSNFRKPIGPKSWCL